jgi:hypothetical protein
VATLGVLTAYIFAGACIFSLTEGWNILDGKAKDFLKLSESL